VQYVATIIIGDKILDCHGCGLAKTKYGRLNPKGLIVFASARSNPEVTALYKEIHFNERYKNKLERFGLDVWGTTLDCHGCGLAKTKTSSFYKLVPPSSLHHPSSLRGTKQSSFVIIFVSRRLCEA